MPEGTPSFPHQSVAQSPGSKSAWTSGCSLALASASTCLLRQPPPPGAPPVQIPPLTEALPRGKPPTSAGPVELRLTPPVPPAPSAWNSLPPRGRRTSTGLPSAGPQNPSPWVWAAPPTQVRAFPDVITVQGKRDLRWPGGWSGGTFPRGSGGQREVRGTFSRWTRRSQAPRCGEDHMPWSTAGTGRGGPTATRIRALPHSPSLGEPPIFWPGSHCPF